MRLFNRVLATIVSLTLITGSAIGIIYLIGLLTHAPALTQLVRGIATSLTRMSVPQIEATLIGVFIVSLVIFVLEISPERARFITIRDDEKGRTQVFRSDIDTTYAIP